MIPVVMAGGFGTRIRPLSANRPKPMLPIVNRPILERVLTHLASFGMNEAVLLTYYDPDKIRAAFGDGKRLGMRLHYNNADHTCTNRCLHHVCGDAAFDLLFEPDPEYQLCEYLSADLCGGHQQRRTHHHRLFAQRYL